LFVAVGHSNKHSFVVALHEAKNNEQYSHASSFIFMDQLFPLSLVYRHGQRDELWWAPCWNCRDGGKISFDETKNQVIISHKW
jgi:hypothetical protein